MWRWHACERQSLKAPRDPWQKPRDLVNSRPIFPAPTSLPLKGLGPHHRICEHTELRHRNTSPSIARLRVEVRLSPAYSSHISIPSSHAYVCHSKYLKSLRYLSHTKYLTRWCLSRRYRSARTRSSARPLSSPCERRACTPGETKTQQ